MNYQDSGQMIFIRHLLVGSWHEIKTLIQSFTITMEISAATTPISVFEVSLLNNKNTPAARHTHNGRVWFKIMSDIRY